MRPSSPLTAITVYSGGSITPSLKREATHGNVRVTRSWPCSIGPQAP